MCIVSLRYGEEALLSRNGLIYNWAFIYNQNTHGQKHAIISSFQKEITSFTAEFDFLGRH